MTPFKAAGSRAHPPHAAISPLLLQHSKTVDHDHPHEGHCGLPEGVVMEGAEFRQRVLNEDGSINSGGLCCRAVMWLSKGGGDGRGRQV